MLDQEPAGDGGGNDSPAQPGRPGITAGKGRPTPKRNEVERRRRQPYTAPADRKAATTQNKERDRAARQRRTLAMRNGEEWALPRKDKGPARALARNVVDSRRSLSEYYLYGVFVLVAILFLPSLRKTLLVDYAILTILVIIVGEGWYVGYKTVTLVRQRLPGESTRGLRLYAAMRGTQIRRLRIPAPVVKPGDKI